MDKNTTPLNKRRDEEAIALRRKENEQKLYDYLARTKYNWNAKDNKNQLIIF